MQDLGIETCKTPMSHFKPNPPKKKELVEPNLKKEIAKTVREREEKNIIIGAEFFKGLYDE